MKLSIITVKKNLKKIRWLRNFCRYLIDKYDKNIKAPRIYRFLNDKYSYIPEKYKATELEPIRILDEWQGEAYPVWVIWLQGEKNMPDCVRICYYSLLNNADGHKVNLITLDNYGHFVDLPEFVLQKYNKGIIPNAHFVDILRMHLLSKHGGLYIDATIMVTVPLNLLKLGTSFWTFKCKDIYTLIGLFYVPKMGSHYVSYLKECFLEYWKKEDKLFSNTLDCYFLDVANIPELMEEIKQVSLYGYNIFSLEDMYNEPFEEKEWAELCVKYPFHRISYKFPFFLHQKRKLTIYGYLHNKYMKS